MRPGGFLRRQTVERVAEAAQSFLTLHAMWQQANDEERREVGFGMLAAEDRLRRATADLDFITSLAGGDERSP